MIYMLMPAGRGRETTMPGMGTGAAAGNPAIALVLALFMLGYLLWIADRLASMSRATTATATEGAFGDQQAAGIPAPATSNGTGTLTLTAAAPTRLTERAGLAPRFAACCKIAMSIGMGYMLITML